MISTQQGAAPMSGGSGSLDNGEQSMFLGGRVGDGAVTWRNFICASTHPVAALFHLAFKVAAIVLYILGQWIFGFEYVTVFVGCVLLLAADFWTVKNITGRLLVGLRWWVRPAEIRQDANNANGTQSAVVSANEWIFESSPQARVNSLDSRIFWWGLYIATLAWLTFSTLSLLKFAFDWLLVCIVGVGLTGTNLFGYFKCSAEAGKRLRATLASGAVAGLSYIPGALPAIGTTMMNILTASRPQQTTTTGASNSPSV